MPPTTEETLLDKTLNLLRADPRSLAAIQRATKLNYFWLRNLKQGTVKNPGVTRVEILFKHLSN